MDIEQDFARISKILSALRPMTPEEKADVEYEYEGPLVAVVDGETWHFCLYSPGGGPVYPALYCLDSSLDIPVGGESPFEQ